MIRFACDSDSLADLAPTPLIFTYADLIRSAAEYSALTTRFPRSVVKLIDRGLGDPAGLAATAMADDETGALTSAQAGARIRAWLAEGRQFVTGYANRSTMPSLEAELAGVTGWWRWFATLDGTMRIPGHPDAMVQFAGAQVTGGRFDLSVVWNGAYHPEAHG